MYDFSTLLGSKELRNKIIFSFLAMIVYRFGTYLVLPGVDAGAVKGVMSDVVDGFGFLGVFNLFSGGALGRMTIFTLNIMPYIVSTIILQLLFFSLNSGSKDDLDSKKMVFYSKILTIFITFIQSFMVVRGLSSVDYSSTYILYNGGLFCFVSIVTMICSTMFLVWLGDQVTVHGITNGISLLIFAGIAAELPSSFVNIFGSMGEIDSFLLRFVLIACIVLAFFLLMWIIVIFERSYRHISIQHPRSQQSFSMRRGGNATGMSYIPVKINISGVIPAIFANAVILLPLTVANFNKDSMWANFIISNFSVGGVLYCALYVVLICFFCFFYSGFIFNTYEISKSLKRSGCIVAGRRPGINTSLYLQYVANRLTVIGSGYLAVISIFPEVIRGYYYMPFAIGGTSVLILVNVTLEILSQVQSCLFSQHYYSYEKRAVHVGIGGDT